MSAGAKDRPVTRRMGAPSTPLRPMGFVPPPLPPIPHTPKRITTELWQAMQELASWTGEDVQQLARELGYEDDYELQAFMYGSHQMSDKKEDVLYVLTAPSDEAVRQLRDEWEKRYKGGSNGHDGSIVLPTDWLSNITR